MKIKRGVAGGVIVALIGALGVGNASETFWGPFFTAFGFSLLVVAAVVGLAVAANRRSASG